MADKNAPGAGDTGRKGVSSGKEFGSNTAITTKTQGWRDWLPVHPAADEFDLLPKDHLQSLADDIRNHGLIERCSYWIDADGRPKLLDGRNRLDALELIGTLDEGDLADRIFEKIVTDDPVVFIISINIHRRHLTPEQRQKHLIALIALAPEKSDRQIGLEARVDGKTIAKARAAGETCGAIPHVEKRKDIKGRKQPASKASAPATRKRGPKPPKNTATELNSLSWSEADAESRRHFVEAVGVASLLEAASPGSDYTILLNVWNRASAEERARFLQFIGAEINEPGAAP
jgi:hypothetical protein